MDFKNEKKKMFHWTVNVLEMNSVQERDLGAISGVALNSPLN